MTLVAGPELAQAKAPTVPAAVTQTPTPVAAAKPARAQSASKALTHAELPPPSKSPRPTPWWEKLFGPAPIPIALTLCATVLTTIVSVTSIVLTYGVGSSQARTAKSAVGVADKSAGAALANARAAEKNADTAATAAQNAGLHHVAKLRQEWINTLRVDLADLQALLRNAVAPAADETVDQARERHERVRLTATKMAKVRLSLNPREIPSQNLLMVLRALDDPRLPPGRRLLLSGWVLRWSQLVLKAEWDRVRHELGAEVNPAKHPPAAGKRDRFHLILKKALEPGPRPRPAPSTTAVALLKAKAPKSRGPNQGPGKV